MTRMTKAREQVEESLAVQREAWAQIGAAMRKAAEDMAQACTQFTKAWEQAVRKDRRER